MELHLKNKQTSNQTILLVQGYTTKNNKKQQNNEDKLHKQNSRDVMDMTEDGNVTVLGV